MQKNPTAIPGVCSLHNSEFLACSWSWAHIASYFCSTLISVVFTSTYGVLRCLTEFASCSE